MDNCGLDWHSRRHARMSAPGGPMTKSRRVHAIVAVASLFAAALAVVGPATPASAATSVTVTPATNLFGGQVVAIDAAGLPSGDSAGWCQAVGSGAPPSTGDCGLNTSGIGLIDSSGDVHGSARLARYIYVPTLGRWVDCVNPAAHCVLAVADSADILGTVGVAPLPFAPPPAPPTTRATIAVQGDSGDAFVSGAGFRPGAVVDVYQCVMDAPDPSGCNSARIEQTVDSTGALRTQAMLITPTVAPLGGASVNCLPRESGACRIVAAEAVDFPGTNVSVPLPPPPPATPTVLPGAVSQREGDSGMTFVPESVRLSSPSTQTVTVQWKTLFVQNASFDQADPATDYTPASGTVTFAPGQTLQIVIIGIKSDTLIEPDELIPVSFGSPTNAVMGGFWGLGFVTITNDDQPTVLPGSASIGEGGSGASNVQLSVRLSEPSMETVTVQWKTLFVPNASFAQADPATDYTPASGLVSFAPGETTKTVTIKVNGGTVVQTNELIVVSFGNPTNAVMGGFWGLGFVTIVNDD
jgi:Neocarzinostatin family/Calx-beta domain